MLDEYFSLHIDPAGQLHTLPLLLNAYSPNLEKLPDFLLRLGTHVNWTEEKSCFADLAREIGLFYAVEPVAGDAIDADHVKPAPNAKHLDIVEHVLFPAFKEHLCVPQKWATTGDIGRIGWGGDCGLRLTGAKS